MKEKLEQLKEDENHVWIKDLFNDRQDSHDTPQQSASPKLYPNREEFRSTLKQINSQIYREIKARSSVCATDS